MITESKNGKTSESKRRKERLDRGIKARADTIFALTSYREALYLLFPRALVVVGMLLVPLVLDTYWTKVVVITCVIGILALSWDFIASAGMFSLGQALFFGLGGYIAGILNHYLGWPPVMTIPVAAVAGGICSALLLLPVLRLRGIYFAMVTFILPLIGAKIIEATGLLGGIAGLSALTPLPNLWVAVYLIIIALIVCLFGFRRVMDTDYGLVLKGMMDNDQAVMASSINIYWYKAQTLFMAASAAAFAGAFMTHYYRFVGIPVFAMDYTILPVASTVVGGVGGFAGAVLGSFILVPLCEALRAIGSWRIVFYSFLMVLFVVVMPEGIFHYMARKYHQFERWVTTE
ncbi:MAG: branched-chain amino acid ABC transporter permease [Desulfatiglans sp.]|jgi:branched-chain amino acid transport system permease protein|nr:branched-chain amino acid ABC transporter permease [Thermodesulfobacteriota bacterium]MEE4354632.1 branched-chain amino acid ABC transporter permease [Desulfatiglans sp.]